MLPIQTFVKNAVVPLLIPLAVKILSIELPEKQRTSRLQRTSQRALEPYQRLDPLEVPHLDFEEWIEKLKAEGKDVSPIHHRKSINPKLRCPDCQAPADYIYYFAQDPKLKSQRYRCKLCLRQFTPDSTRQRPRFLCPHCLERINFKKHRRQFDIYKCINHHCPHKLGTGSRYTYRHFLISLADLSAFCPQPKPVDLRRLHFSPSILVLAVALAIGFGLSLRQVATFFQSFFLLSITQQTILNYIYIAASLLHPLLTRLPLAVSSIWVIDETYLRAEGQWGYLLTVLDSVSGAIIAQIFSSTRSTVAAAAVLQLAIERVKVLPHPLTIVTDGWRAYPPAIEIVSKNLKAPIHHVQVIGLSNPKHQPKNEFRPYKNLIENFHSVLKPYYKRWKAFFTFDGGIAFSVLFQIFYNYVRSSSRHKGAPPQTLTFIDSSNPLLGWHSLFRLALTSN